MDANDFDWIGYYYGMTQQATLAIKKAEAEGNDFYLGVSLFTKAEAFGIMASLWGDMPYNQANDLLTFPNPKFDGQIEVLNKVLDLFAQSISAFESNKGLGDEGNIDWYYGGDPDSWIAAAHSMMARYSMQLKDYTAAAAHASSGIMVSSNDMLIPHSGGAYNQDMNIYHSFGVRDRSGYIGANDAHLPNILHPDTVEFYFTNDTVTISFELGSKYNAKTNERARFEDLYVFTDTIIGSWDLNYGSYFSATSSFPAMSALENILIRSESKFQTSDVPGALSDLNLARAELAARYPTGMYDAYVMSDFDNGGIADHGKGSTDANLYYEIMQEKYASLVGQIQVFNDFRRTENILGLTPAAGAVFPERFLIPQTELDGNPNAPSPIPGMFEKTPVNQ
jgi:hypothetical protein